LQGHPKTLKGAGDYKPLSGGVYWRCNYCGYWLV